MRQLCGIYDFENNQYIDKSKEIQKYIDDDTEIYLLGKVKLNQNDINAELLRKIYQKYGNKITKEIKGIYILIIYDKIKKEIHIFQDRTTSSQTMYYTLNNNKVYFGTSLKWLLKESKIERKLNDSIIEEFLTNGFIYGKETLIENVYKIKAFNSLKIKNNKIEEATVEYSLDNMTKGEALQKWETTLSTAINNCFADKEEINIPLSSGYDSNYIAHVASLEGHKLINAFSIGGKFGKNELPIVEQNVCAYNKMKLSTTLTDELTLSNLPDIVWRLEGAVYEVGIFLQYELCKLVNKHRKTSLICGECADQVMNQYYLEYERIFVPQKKEQPVYYEFSEYPYIFGSYLILKKNGILSNSFGIETEYPYLDEDFVSISHNLRNINKKDKRIHVAVCQEQLPKIVKDNIAKIGGATDFHSLFDCKEVIDRFLLNVEKSEFYKKYASLIKRTSYIEKEKQTGIKKFKTKVRNMVMDVCHLNVNERMQTIYFWEEIKLKEYMCCVYLMLFEKLFVSGEFDDVLECEGVNIDLYKLIG